VTSRGHTLIELAAAVAVLAVLVGASLPRLAVAAESARVDECGGVLRAIWSAQRLHRLETGAYAPSLDALAGLDPAIAPRRDPFAYEIVASGAKGFRARATRAGGAWRGSIEIDEGGALSGHVADPEGRRVAP